MMDLGAAISTVCVSFQANTEGYTMIFPIGSGTTASWALSMAQRFTWVECIGVGEWNAESPAWCRRLP